MRFSLKRVPLNQGGYTSDGQYYGRGKPLYVAVFDDPSDTTDVQGTPWCPHGFNYVEHTFRAYDRDDAKAIVRSVYPAATFYR